MSTAGNQSGNQSTNQARFTGRTVIVTGGASGIGRATAERFLEEGANVLISDLNGVNGQAAIDEWAARFGRDRVRLAVGSVADEDHVAAMVAEATHLWGTLDVMFNNAGIGGAFGPLTEVAVDDWDRTFEVLVRGVFLGTKHAARTMIPQGGGCIINTASVAGLAGGSGHHAYSAAKTAVVSLTRTSAEELARHRIRVNAVAPGVIFTPLAVNKDESNLARVVERMQPWPERGEAEHIAAAVAFLASDDASFVVGETLLVDGGLLSTGSRIQPEMDPHGALQRYTGFGQGSTGLGTTSRRLQPKDS